MRKLIFIVLSMKMAFGWAAPSEPNEGVTVLGPNPVVINSRIQVIGPDQTELVPKVRQELMNDPEIYPQVSKLSFQNLNGEIIVSGTVPSPAAEQSILNRINRTNGVRSVVNQMKVETSDKTEIK